MVRNILAVIAGWFGSIVVWLLLMIAWYVLASLISPEAFPLPPRAGAAPPSAVWFLAGTLVCDAIAGFVAGYLIAWMARKPAHRVMWIVTVIMALLLVTQTLVEHGELPLWVGAVRPFVMLAALWAGAHLRGLDPKPPAPGPKPQDMREKNMAC
jgi:hypothetical protein